MARIDHAKGVAWVYEQIVSVKDFMRLYALLDDTQKESICGALRQQLAERVRSYEVFLGNADAREPIFEKIRKCVGDELTSIIALVGLSSFAAVAAFEDALNLSMALGGIWSSVFSGFLPDDKIMKEIPITTQSPWPPTTQSPWPSPITYPYTGSGSGNPWTTKGWTIDGTAGTGPIFEGTIISW